tara:strand:+ start:2134 stop:2391 length:258 start_codon:yes stop_codon:yes gene_type:complete
METPGVTVPIPIPHSNILNNNLNSNEMKCSYNTFDPSSSPPQESLFLKNLIKRIGSFDKLTVTDEKNKGKSSYDLDIKSCSELKK